jgi:Uma2 family endonuclease
MVQTPTNSETISIELPTAIALYLTPEQFEAIANRGLRLERLTDGELIVNPPTGWETGGQNWQISGQLYVW